MKRTKAYTYTTGVRTRRHCICRWREIIWRVPNCYSLPIWYTKNIYFLRLLQGQTKGMILTVRHCLFPELSHYIYEIGFGFTNQVQPGFARHFDIRRKNENGFLATFRHYFFIHVPASAHFLTRSEEVSSSPQVNLMSYILPDAWSLWAQL